MRIGASICGPVTPMSSHPVLGKVYYHAVTIPNKENPVDIPEGTVDWPIRLQFCSFPTIADGSARRFHAAMACRLPMLVTYGLAAHNLLAQ